MAASLREKGQVWTNVYRRIRFFRKMYPLTAIAKDLFLFPIDYFIDGRDIKTVRNVTIAITHKCNIRCRMCYFHKELANRHELPFDLFKQVIDAVAKTRPCVILSGGEPFTHPRLLDMVACAKAKGLPVQIFTNGTLVKPGIADQLVELGLDYINFTLLGNKTTHPFVAQAPKSYDMLTKNLAYFAKHRGNTQVMLNYTITPESLNDINHAVKLARRHKLDGVRFQHLNFLRQSEFNAQSKVMNRIFGVEAGANEIEETKDLSGMGQGLSEFIEGSLNNDSIPFQWAPTLTADEMANWYSLEKFKTNRKCLYPWRGMLVDADGKVYPCSKIYLELGDLRKNDIFQIWNGDQMQKFRSQLKKRLFPACSRCCKL